MKYLRVTDLLARHYKLPMVDVPNIAYYDCRDLPDWSLAYNDKTVQLLCSATFINGSGIECICCSMNDLKLFIKDVNFYARNCVKLQKAKLIERAKRAKHTLQELIEQKEENNNA